MMSGIYIVFFDRPTAYWKNGGSYTIIKDI